MSENDQKKIASAIVLKARAECRKKKINPYIAIGAFIDEVIRELSLQLGVAGMSKRKERGLKRDLTKARELLSALQNQPVEVKKKRKRPSGGGKKNKTPKKKAKKKAIPRKRPRKRAR